jgi:hypothetical protein
MKIYNKLTVTGIPEDCLALMDRLAAPVEVAYVEYATSWGPATPTLVMMSAPVFSLHSIRKPIIKGNKEYMSSWDNVRRWNSLNWGVSEDVTEPILESATFSEVVYRFISKDNYPSLAMASLSSMHPGMQFSLDSTRPPGGGGRARFINGVFHTDVTWRDPITHRSFEKVRGIGTCECSEMSEKKLRLRPRYFDCPQGSVDTATAVLSMSRVSLPLAGFFC